MQAFNALWTLLIYYIYIFAFILMCAQLWPTRTHTHTHCTAMHSHSNNQITLKHTFIASIYCCLPFEFVAIFSIFQFNGISPFFLLFFYLFIALENWQHLHIYAMPQRLYRIRIYIHVQLGRNVKYFDYISIVVCQRALRVSWNIIRSSHIICCFWLNDASLVGNYI